MLILNLQDIESCQLTDNNASLDKISPGISYQKLLFIPVTSFAKTQRKKAEVISRQFLQQEKPLISIILKEESRISIWVEATNYQLINPQIEENPLPEKKNQNQAHSSSIKWFMFILPFLLL